MLNVSILYLMFLTYLFFSFATEYKRLLQDAKLELKKSKRKDYYKILGLGRDANEDAIKKAYRKYALLHHPGVLLYFTPSYLNFYCVRIE